MATITSTATRTATTSRKPARTPHGTARLALTINGTRYAVKPIPCDCEAAQRCYSLRKNDGTVYHVALTVYGPSCDCPDFVFHRDGLDAKGCKHVRSLAAFGMLATMTPVSVPPIRGGAPVPSDPYGEVPRRRQDAISNPTPRRPRVGANDWSDRDQRKHHGCC